MTLQAVPFETTSLFTCSSDAPANPITVRCTGGAVNQGQNATIKINAISPGTGTQITNTSVVDPDNAIAESNELNNTSASVNTALEGPPAGPLLAISKSDGKPDQDGAWDAGAGPDPVNPGETLTYKIQVKNNATSRADDVRISDATQGLEATGLTASQVVVNGTVGTGRGCVVNAPDVVCSVRSLNAGGTITVTISGRVIAPAGSNLFNTATVNGNIRNVGVTNTASESTTVRPSIDFTIVKTDSPDPACARTWPTDVTGHLANPPDNYAGSPASGAPTPLLADPVCLGGLTYRFVVGNSGNGDAIGNVRVRDPLPAGVIFDSYSTNGGFACAVDAANVVTCTGGTVPAAATRWIELRLVAPPGTGTITNTVTVDPNNAIFEPDETNNTDTETTQVTTGIDLVVWKGDSKSADPPGTGAPALVPGTATDLGDGYDPIATRGTQTYTVYVDNVGTQNVTGIRVRDTLPADTVFLSVIPDNDHGFTCTHNGAQYGGVIECVGGHLLGTEAEFYNPAGPAPAGPGDDIATIKIRVFARATVGSMHNEVRVDPLNEIDEVNELNNLDTETTTVEVGNADKGAYHQLAIEKLQHSPADDVATSGILVYDLKVSNLGTDPVSAIRALDTLPSGTRFISAKDTDVGTSLSDAFFCSHSGTATGGVVTCVGGDLSGSINVIPDGGGTVPTFRTIRITVYAPAIPGNIVNVAGVDPDNTVAEGNEFDNDSALETTVRPCTSLVDCTATNAVYELTVDKTQANPANPAARNGIVTYHLTVANWGSQPISDVVVTDRLPAGFRFIDAADTASGEADAFTCQGPDAQGVVRCTGGVLAGVTGGIADTRVIEINVWAPDVPGSYTNTAFVDPGNAIPEGNEFNNQDSLNTVVANGGNRPYIDLRVEKTQVAELDQETLGDGRVRVDTGQVIHYQLKVVNGGEDGDAFNVRVRDFLPSNVTFFSAADSAPGAGAFTCGLMPAQPTVIDCIGGTVPQDGGSRTIDVFVVAPVGLDRIASNPGVIRQVLTNTAIVDPDQVIPEGDETNNTSALQTVVESQVNLKVVSKEGPSTANQNQEADYVITVVNEKTWGDGRIAFNAVVVDYLPIGLIPLSVSTNKSNLACETQENPVNLVTCTGDLEPDQPVEITVHVFITADGGTLDNEACIDPGHLIDETSELDNCKTKTTAVEPPAEPNLNINKNASTSTVTPGETFTYTVTVANVGNAPTAGGVTITDDLPPEVTFVSANATNGFICAEASGIVTCSGSALAAGASTVATIEVTVNDGVTTSFTNKAEVNEGTPNESASVTTNVGGTSVDLVLSDITDSPDPANIGQNVTYSFTVSNAGTGGSGAFEIKATMDSVAGLTFVGASASQGFTCGGLSGLTVTCSGPDLPAGQATEVKVTFMVSGASPSTHELTVKADSGDTVTEASEANNQDTETTSTSAALCTGCVDLVIGGILDSPDPITADGQTVTFITTASNAGDIPTTGNGPVVVRFSLPIRRPVRLGIGDGRVRLLAGELLHLRSPRRLDVRRLLRRPARRARGRGHRDHNLERRREGCRHRRRHQILVSSASVDPDGLFPEGPPLDAAHEFTNDNNGPAIEFTTFEE